MSARWRLLLALLAVAASSFAGCAPAWPRPEPRIGSCPEGRAGPLGVRFWAITASGERPLVAAEWEFGDGTPPQAGLTDVVHAFAEVGDFRVTLTVTDDRGVRGTVTETFRAESPAFIDPGWRLLLGYPPEVTGVVGNRSAVPLRSVVVRVRFYDAGRVRLEEQHVEISDLASGERARFGVKAASFLSHVFSATVEVESFVAVCDGTSPGEPKGVSGSVEGALPFP